jgi:DNA polymerase-4
MQPVIREQGLTLIGVAVANLDDDGIQLDLPFDRHSGSALDTAIDEVRLKFGLAAVTRAVLLGHDERPSVPLLPD